VVINQGGLVSMLTSGLSALPKDARDLTTVRWNSYQFCTFYKVSRVVALMLFCLAM
jgi:hypothetical protein